MDRAFEWTGPVLAGQCAVRQCSVLASPVYVAMLTTAAAVCAACAVWAVFIPDTQGTAIPQAVLYAPQGQDSPNASRVLLVAAASEPDHQEAAQDDEDKARQLADEEDAVQDKGHVQDEEGDGHAHEDGRLQQHAHDKDDEEEQLREQDAHEDAVDEEAAAEDDADKEALEDADDDARKEPRVTEEPAEDGDGGDGGSSPGAAFGLAGGLQAPDRLTWPSGWLWDSGPGRMQAPGQHAVPAVFGVGRDYRRLGMRAAFVPLPQGRAAAARTRRAARATRAARDAGDDFDDGLFRDAGFDALEEAGNQDFQEVASKGRHGHEDHKHSSEEKGGKWEDDKEQGEDKGGKHFAAEGQKGHGHHHADKHATEAGKKGFRDKYNFDKTQKSRSFYKNGRKKGSSVEWGHDDSYFFDNDAGDETGKFEKSGKQEKHSGHSGKSAHQHADEGGDEWGGKTGFENHYSDAERFAEKDNQHKSDGYGYGTKDSHADRYKLTPGFYSWGRK